MRQADYLVADQTRFWYSFQQKSWERTLASGYFETIAAQDGYLIAQRRPVDHLLNLAFGDQVTLRGYSILWGNDGPWGRTLRPVLEWQANQRLAERYSIGVRVMDVQQHVWAQEDREPQEGAFPTNLWPLNKPVGDQYNFPIPPTMPSGYYEIAVSAHNLTTGKELGTETTIGTVQITKDKGSYTASQLFIEQPFFVDMGEIRFLGSVQPRQTISRGELMQVGLYWRARGKPRGDYQISLQLHDAAGAVAFEDLARPAAGTYPTTQWDEGEVLLDWHDSDLSAVKPGRYSVKVRLTDVSGASILGEVALPADLTVEP